MQTPPYSILPVLGLRTVEVVLPVADAELLVEGGVVGAHVGDTAAVLVTHMEELAVELLVGVEAHWPVRAVKRKGDVGEFLPPLGLERTKRNSEALRVTDSQSIKQLMSVLVLGE